MSTDLIKSNWESKLAYSRTLAASGLLPSQYRQNPANLLWAIEYGDMIGLSPMAAVTGVHVIEGKPTASSALISALVRRAGHKLRVSGDDREAVCEIIRKDDPSFTFRCVWTIERAKQAGLTGKGVWKSYPAAMLKARAITECARDACEDAILGLHYTPEELGAEVDADGVPVEAAPAKVVEAVPSEHHESWAADRAGFCAWLGEQGWQYDHVATFCETLGKPRPSQMTGEGRRALSRWLQGAGAERWQAFLAIHTANDDLQAVEAVEAE